MREERKKRVQAGGKWKKRNAHREQRSEPNVWSGLRSRGEFTGREVDWCRKRNGPKESVNDENVDRMNRSIDVCAPGGKAEKKKGRMMIYQNDQEQIDETRRRHDFRGTTAKKISFRFLNLSPFFLRSNDSKKEWERKKSRDEESLSFRLSEIHYCHNAINTWQARQDAENHWH